eukprot:gene13425-9236_t
MCFWCVGNGLGLFLCSSPVEKKKTFEDEIVQKKRRECVRVLVENATEQPTNQRKKTSHEERTVSTLVRWSGGGSDIAIIYKDSRLPINQLALPIIVHLRFKCARVISFILPHLFAEAPLPGVSDGYVGLLICRSCSGRHIHVFPIHMEHCSFYILQYCVGASNALASCEGWWWDDDGWSCFALSRYTVCIEPHRRNQDPETLSSIMTPLHLELPLSTALVLFSSSLFLCLFWAEDQIYRIRYIIYIYYSTEKCCTCTSFSIIFAENCCSALLCLTESIYLALHFATDTQGTPHLSLEALRKGWCRQETSSLLPNFIRMNRYSTYHFESMTSLIYEENHAYATPYRLYLYPSSSPSSSSSDSTTHADSSSSFKAKIGLQIWLVVYHKYISHSNSMHRTISMAQRGQRPLMGALVRLPQRLAVAQPRRTPPLRHRSDQLTNSSSSSVALLPYLRAFAARDAHQRCSGAERTPAAPLHPVEAAACPLSSRVSMLTDSSFELRRQLRDATWVVDWARAILTGKESSNNNKCSSIGDLYVYPSRFGPAQEHSRHCLGGPVASREGEGGELAFGEAVVRCAARRLRVACAEAKDVLTARIPIAKSYALLMPAMGPVSSSGAMANGSVAEEEEEEDAPFLIRDVCSAARQLTVLLRVVAQLRQTVAAQAWRRVGGDSTPSQRSSGLQQEMECCYAALTALIDSIAQFPAAVGGGVCTASSARLQVVPMEARDDLLLALLRSTPLHSLKGSMRRGTGHWQRWGPTPSRAAAPAPAPALFISSRASVSSLQGLLQCAAQAGDVAMALALRTALQSRTNAKDNSKAEANKDAKGEQQNDLLLELCRWNASSTTENSHQLPHDKRCGHGATASTAPHQRLARLLAAGLLPSRLPAVADFEAALDALLPPAAAIATSISPTPSTPAQVWRRGAAISRTCSDSGSTSSADATPEHVRHTLVLLSIQLWSLQAETSLVPRWSWADVVVAASAWYREVRRGAKPMVPSPAAAAHAAIFSVESAATTLLAAYACLQQHPHASSGGTPGLAAAAGAAVLRLLDALVGLPTHSHHEDNGGGGGAAIDASGAADLLLRCRDGALAALARCYDVEQEAQQLAPDNDAPHPLRGVVEQEADAPCGTARSSPPFTARRGICCAARHPAAVDRAEWWAHLWLQALHRTGRELQDQRYGCGRSGAAAARRQSALLEALVSVSLYVSPFTISRMVEAANTIIGCRPTTATTTTTTATKALPCGRVFSVRNALNAAQCRRLIPRTLPGSRAQLVLLRRLAELRGPRAVAEAMQPLAVLLDPAVRPAREGRRRPAHRTGAATLSWWHHESHTSATQTRATTVQLTAIANGHKTDDTTPFSILEALLPALPRHYAAPLPSGGTDALAEMRVECRLLRQLLEPRWDHALAALAHALPAIDSAPTERKAVDPTAAAASSLECVPDPAAAAAHALQLLVWEADAWWSVDGVLRRRLLRIALGRRPADAAAGPAIEDMDHLHALATTLYETLQASLARGLWRSGLALYQLLQEEAAAVLEMDPRGDRHDHHPAAAAAVARVPHFLFRRVGALLLGGWERTSARAKAMAIVSLAGTRGEWAAVLRAVADLLEDEVAVGVGCEEREVEAQTLSAKEIHRCATSLHTATTQGPRSPRSRRAMVLQQLLQTWPTTHVRLIAYAAQHVWRSHQGVEAPVTDLSPSASVVDDGAAAAVSCAHGRVQEHAPQTTSTRASIHAVGSAPVGAPGTARSVARPAALELHTPTPVRLRRQQRSVSERLYEQFTSGEWAAALRGFKAALRGGALAHEDAATLLAAALRGRDDADATPPGWQVALECFGFLSQRVRPDVYSSVVAMEACASGGQWELALRVMQQSLFTQSRPPPRLFTLALETTMRSGCWAAALGTARRLRHSRQPALLHAVLRVYAGLSRWGDVVEVYYENAMRGGGGVALSEEGARLALLASERAGEEYQGVARAVASMAAAIEDVLVLSGAVLDHVVLVYQRWVTTTTTTSLWPGGSPDVARVAQPSQTTPAPGMHCEAGESA